MASCSRRQKGGRMPPTPPLMQLMKYAVPVVLALLILQYQLKPEALFRRNRGPTWCFVVATCVYWLMVGATKQNMGREGWINGKVKRCAALACGTLSALSLLSMFLPYPASLLPLLLWMPLALLLTWQTACRWIRRPRIMTTDIITKVEAMAVRARGLISTNQPPILPV